MLVLDFMTLYIVIFLNALTVSIIWAAINFTYPGFLPARLWLVSTVVTLCGGLILSIQGNDGAFWPAVIGNTIIIFGFCLSWMGAYAFYNERPRVKLSLVVTACSLAAMLLFHSSWQGRNIVYAVGQSVPMALILLFLLSKRPLGLGAQITIIALLLGIVGHAVETILNLVTWADLFDDQFYLAIESYALVMVIYSAVIWNFGFIIMAINKFHGEIARTAETDELTGLPNRRYFMKMLARAEQDCVEQNAPYAVLLIDIDNFKRWNDTYGHAAGDHVLKHFADVAGNVLGEKALLARLGGDEFCVLVSGQSKDEIIHLTEKLIQVVRNTSFKIGKNYFKHTVSIGVAIEERSMKGNKVDILARADAKLYKVKQAGRNGYATYSETIVGKAKPESNLATISV